MDELSQIQADFLQGQEWQLRGMALQASAFNRLVRLKQPAATGLFPTFGLPLPKPDVKGASHG